MRRHACVFSSGLLSLCSCQLPSVADSVTQRLYAQVVLGRYLRHPNVARCPGAIVHLSTYQPRWPEPQMPGVPSMATECAQYGSLLSFVKANPNCDLVSLVGTHRQCCDSFAEASTQLYNAARGLAYVHSLGFYHSDVKQVRQGLCVPRMRSMLAGQRGC
jgi:serine/threonine protein kinase